MLMVSKTSSWMCEENCVKLDSINLNLVQKKLAVFLICLQNE